MPVTFSSYRLGPGQRVSNKTVPPPWDWLLRRENELGPRRSKSRIIFAVLVPPLYVAVQAPALIVTKRLQISAWILKNYIEKIHFYATKHICFVCSRRALLNQGLQVPALPGPECEPPGQGAGRGSSTVFAHPLVHERLLPGLLALQLRVSHPPSRP